MTPNLHPMPGAESIRADPEVVDVVVLTWNDAAVADRAIEAAAASQGVVVRLHVVDNGSSAPYAPAIPGANLIRLPANLGVAAGRNIGSQGGSAPLLCLLDSDAVLAPEALAYLTEALRDPGVAVAVPVFEGQQPEASAGMRPTLARKLLRGFGLTSTYRAADAAGPLCEVEFAIGACQLIRRSSFEALGGLDARYFFGPEDIDFCDRVRRAGWTIVQVRGARVHHVARRSHRSLLTFRGIRHAVALLRFYTRARPGSS